MDNPMEVTNPGISYIPKTSTRPPLANRLPKKEHKPSDVGSCSAVDLDQNKGLLSKKTQMDKDRSDGKYNSGRHSPIQALCWGLCNKQIKDDDEAGPHELSQWRWMNKDQDNTKGRNQKPPFKSVLLKPKNKRRDKNVPKCYMSRGGDSTISSKTNVFSSSSRSTNDMELHFPHIFNANAIHSQNFLQKSKPPQKEKKPLYGRIKSLITSDNEDDDVEDEGKKVTTKKENSVKEKNRVPVDNKKEVIDPQHNMSPDDYERMLAIFLHKDDKTSPSTERQEQEQKQEQTNNCYYYDHDPHHLSRRSFFSASPTETETASSASSVASWIHNDTDFQESVASWNHNDKNFEESISTITNSHKNNDDEKNKKRHINNIEMLWLNGMASTTPTAMNTTRSSNPSPTTPKHSIQSTPPRSAFRKKQNPLTSLWKKEKDSDQTTNDFRVVTPPRRNSKNSPSRTIGNTTTSSSLLGDDHWKKLDDIIQKELTISSSAPQTPVRNKFKPIVDEIYLPNGTGTNITENKINIVTPENKKNTMKLKLPPPFENISINNKQIPFKTKPSSVPTTPTHSFYQSDFCKQSSENDIDSIGKGDLAYLALSNSYDDSINNSNSSTPVPSPLRPSTPKRTKKNRLLMALPSFSLPTTPTGSVHGNDFKLSEQLNVNSWRSKKKPKPLRSQSCSPGRMGRGDLAYLSLTKSIQLRLPTTKNKNDSISQDSLAFSSAPSFSTQGSLAFSSISLPSTPSHSVRKSEYILNFLKNKGNKTKANNKNKDDNDNSTNNDNSLLTIPKFDSPDKNGKNTFGTKINDSNNSKNSSCDNNRFIERSQSCSPGRIGRGDLAYLSLSRSFSNEEHHQIRSGNYQSSNAIPRGSAPPRPTTRVIKDTNQQLMPSANRPSLSLPSTPTRSQLFYQSTSDDNDHISTMKMKKRMIETAYLRNSNNLRNARTLAPRPVTPRKEKSTIIGSIHNNSTKTTTTATVTPTRTTNRSGVIRQLRSRSPSPIGRGDLAYASLTRSFSSDNDHQIEISNNADMRRLPIPPRPSTPRSSTKYDNSHHSSALMPLPPSLTPTRQSIPRPTTPRPSAPRPTTPRPLTSRLSSKYDNGKHSSALMPLPPSLTPTGSTRKSVSNPVNRKSDVWRTTSLNENLNATINKNDEFIRRSQSPIPGRLGMGDVAYASLSRSFSKDDNCNDINRSNHTNEPVPDLPISRRHMRKEFSDGMYESDNKQSDTRDSTHRSSKFRVSMDHDGFYSIASPSVLTDEDESKKILPSAPQPSSKNIGELVNQLSNMRANFNNSHIDALDYTIDKINQPLSSLSLGDGEKEKTSKLPHSSSLSMSNITPKTTKQEVPRSHSCSHISEFDMTIKSVGKDSDSDSDYNESKLHSMNDSEGQDEQDQLELKTSQMDKDNSSSQTIMKNSFPDSNPEAKDSNGAVDNNLSLNTTSSQNSNVDVLDKVHLDITRPSAPPLLHEKFPEKDPSPSLRNELSKASRSDDPLENHVTNSQYTPPDVKLHKNGENAPTSETYSDMITDGVPKRKMLVKYIGRLNDLHGTIVEVIDDSFDCGIIRIMSPSKGRPFFVEKKDIEMLDVK